MAAKFGLLIDAKTKGENNIKRLGNSMQGVEGKAKNLGMAVRGVGAAFKGVVCDCCCWWNCCLWQKSQLTLLMRLES